LQFTAKLVQLELDLLLMLRPFRLESDGSVDPVDLSLRPACERQSVARRPSSRDEGGGAPANIPWQVGRKRPA
jgi:hypothetical protein